MQGERKHTISNTFFLEPKMKIHDMFSQEKVSNSLEKFNRINNIFVGNSLQDKSLSTVENYHHMIFQIMLRVFDSFLLTMNEN